MALLNQHFMSSFRRLLDGSYRHLRYPAVLRARVTAMEKVGTRTWRYRLKPISHDPLIAELPEIPDIRSHVEVEAGVGGTVAIALINGTPAQVVIVDEVIS